MSLVRETPFPRDAVFAWWTDFREDDHHHADSPAASTRTIVRRTGNEFWLRDRATRPIRVTIEEHVILNPPLGYAVEARYPAADVRYTYRFDAEGDSTRVTLDADVRPRHIGRILIPLTAAWWRRYTARDLDFHLDVMRRDLSR
ncbi:MAG TPA: hypothetical protein VIZ58_10140 [Thermoanaerobaculia bacterium]